MAGRKIKMTVNGKAVELMVEKKVYASQTLARTLRETLGLTGTKIGCDHGECGACTVLIDNEPVMSCMVLTVECDHKEIITIEGLSDSVNGELHPIQKAFIDNFGFQCGFCTPGIIMASKALLDRNLVATEREIKDALSGNLCRCGNYPNIIKSIQAASQVLRDDENG